MELKCLLIRCLLLLGLAGKLWAGVHYVRANAPGDQSGRDWKNAYSALPEKLVRGDTYYIADGLYRGYLFDEPEQKGQYITIKKAVAADHGSDIGWLPEYGDGVARFQGVWDFRSSYWILDGQTGGGPGNWESGHGFELSNTFLPNNTNSRLVLIGKAGVGYITIKHVNIHPVNIDGFGSMVYAHAGGSEQVTFSHCWMHSIFGPIFHTSVTRGWTVEYSKLADNHGTSRLHSELWSLLGDDDVTIRYCWLEDARSTGFIIAINGPDAHPPNHMNYCDNWKIYGNIFRHNTGVTCPFVIAAIANNSNRQYARNWKIHNNTFISLNTTGRFIQVIKLSRNGGAANAAYNNIFWKCPPLDFAGVEHDYNWFSGNNNYAEFHGMAGGNENLFMNVVRRDFHLTHSLSGKTLEPHFREDMDGLTRGRDGEWERGALEFNAGPPDLSPPSIPGGLSISFVGTHQAEIGWRAAKDPESGVAHYRILRDGNIIGEAAKTAFLDKHLSPGKRYQYRVIAVNRSGLASPASQVLSVRTLEDKTAPEIRYFQSGEKNINIHFNEELDRYSAEYSGNYQIIPEIKIIDVRLSEDRKTITLFTEAHQLKVNYLLKISGIRDLSANIMSAAQLEYQYITGLLAYWRFEARLEGIAVDSSGNGNNLQIQGAYRKGEAFGNALVFDGDDYLYLPEQKLNGQWPGKIKEKNQAFSIVAWIYRRGSDARQPIISKQSTREPGRQRGFLLAVDQGKLNLELYTNESLFSSVVTTQKITEGRWHHIVAGYKFAGNGESQVRLYIDGKLSGSTEQAVGPLQENPQPLEIGRYWWNTNYKRYWKGMIDEIRVYNRMLSKDEIELLYQNPGFSNPEYQASAYYQLHPNYPNPFNPFTTISFSLPKESLVKIQIYNILGQKVAVLLNEILPPGPNSVRWHPKGLPSGIYYYQMRAGTFRKARKMILLR